MPAYVTYLPLINRVFVASYLSYRLCPEYAGNVGLVGTRMNPRSSLPSHFYDDNANDSATHTPNNNPFALPPSGLPATRHSPTDPFATPRHATQPLPQFAPHSGPPPGSQPPQHFVPSPQLPNPQYVHPPYAHPSDAVPQYAQHLIHTQGEDRTSFCSA